MAASGSFKRLLSNLRRNGKKEEDSQTSPKSVRLLSDKEKKKTLWQLGSAPSIAAQVHHVSSIPHTAKYHALMTQDTKSIGHDQILFAHGLICNMPYSQGSFFGAAPTIIPILQVVLSLDSRNLGINQPGDDIGRNVWQHTNEFLSRDGAFVRRTTPETASVVVAESFNEEIQCKFQKKRARDDLSLIHVWRWWLYFWGTHSRHWMFVGVSFLCLLFALPWESGKTNITHHVLLCMRLTCCRGRFDY